jgi:hypothetical protein
MVSVGRLYLWVIISLKLIVEAYVKLGSKSTMLAILERSAAWRIAVSAACGAIYGFGSGSDMADSIVAFLSQDVVGQWVAAQFASVLPIGATIGGAAAAAALAALRIVDLSFVMGLAGGTIVGFILSRPSSWEMEHPFDVFSVVLWQQIVAFAGGVLVWGCKKLLTLAALIG